MKFHVCFLIGKKIAGLMILTLRTCEAALIKCYKRNFSSGVSY